MDSWLFWIIVCVALVIIEVMSQMLWALCLAVGALIAMVASLLGADMVWQLIIMAVGGLLTYVTVFPWFRRYHNRKSAHTSRTGMDALLGRTAIVTDRIRPGRTGRARIDGDNWQVTAPSEHEELPSGTEVVVTGYDSIILQVAKLKTPSN